MSDDRTVRELALALWYIKENWMAINGNKSRFFEEYFQGQKRIRNHKKFLGLRYRGTTHEMRMKELQEWASQIQSFIDLNTYDQPAIEPTKVAKEWWV